MTFSYTPIGVFGGAGTPEEVGGPELLAHIAESTGGRMFFAEPADLPDVAKKIGIDCATGTYSDTRQKTRCADGKYLPCGSEGRVSARTAKLQAHWRVGYNAPER
ncbi:MAG: hypothetical protein WDO73_06705 [Ignavibacteriota bacterium]